MHDENLDKLMETYASESAVNSARREKRESIDPKFDRGELIKDYPDPQRELDLHQHTVPEAIFQIKRFLKNARMQRLRTVRLITGRGLHSKNMIAVLPDAIENELLDLRRAGEILDFKRERKGGSFAVYLIS